jgi:hypothetical protein
MFNHNDLLITEKLARAHSAERLKEAEISRVPVAQADRPMSKHKLALALIGAMLTALLVGWAVASAAQVPQLGDQSTPSALDTTLIPQIGARPASGVIAGATLRPLCHPTEGPFQHCRWRGCHPHRGLQQRGGWPCRRGVGREFI